MLLRELQGEGADGDGESRSDDDDGSGGGQALGRGLREKLSPTPTPAQRRPSAIATTASTSSEDEGQPPQSLMYAVAGSSRTPTAARMPHSRAGASASPGPFKPALSSSASESRSRSTSPGPSTISNYASGLDATNLEPSDAVSPTRRVPTFREPVRPSPPARAVSASSSKRKSPRTGYLDPPLSSVSASRKGKGKAKTVAGRQYHQVARGDHDEEAHEDYGANRTKPLSKQGLNEYEKALWKWVNVDDLDGFLQEVSATSSLAPLSRFAYREQVYAFYKGKGFYCIFLAKLLNLL